LGQATAGSEFARNPNGDDFVRKLGLASFRQGRKQVEGATQRRKLTPEFLGKVADIHTTAPDGGRIDAVKAAFNVEERQALRYIAQARKRGLIDG
jgi:hypothetical protein